MRKWSICLLFLILLAISVSVYSDDHILPTYTAQPKKISDMLSGGIKIIYIENGDINSSGLIKIQPGGRAVFGIDTPLNVQAPELEIEVSGPVKIQAVQPGMAETIELGETLLWDAPDSAKPQTMQTRKIALNEFVNRYARQRGWSLPHITTNGLYFVTLQSVADKPVSIKNVSFYGKPLTEMQKISPQVNCDSKIIENGEIENLIWTVPAEAKRWWGGETLCDGSKISSDGVSFTLCPTVLSYKCKSVGISVNSKVGLFHIAHCAGARNQPWMGTYLFVYSDGSTEAAFATLRWNCGVYKSEWIRRGQGDYTWWGPPAFSWASTYHIPDAGRPFYWQSVYVMTLRNPHPEKVVKQIIAATSSPKSDLALLGISFTPVSKAVVGLVEPEMAVLYPNRPERISVMRWSADKIKSGKTSMPLKMVKPDNASIIGDLTVNSIGHFSGASGVFSISEKTLQPGPVRLTCDGVSSSLLGWMANIDANGKPYYLSMLAGGGESPAEFERIKRLGYDAVKVHMNWSDVEEPQPGKFDWSAWESRFNTISQAGLKISIRNRFIEGPTWLQKQIKPLKALRDGKVQNLTRYHVDPADPAYRTALTEYYRTVGKLAAGNPDVISINANYGIRFSPGFKKGLNFGYYQLKAFHEYMEKHFSLKDINARTGMKFDSYTDITPQAVFNDKSGFLMAEYARDYYSHVNSLQWDVARAIRENSKAHLVFNHAYEPSERAIIGACIEEYLKIGRDLKPASPFHETSDRYCLSFSKWLAAKATMGLPYGDEGNQNPPTYEHNVLSYIWMLWMQCWDSLYCQWWGGRPGSQNIAWLKPYYSLIYNAEYMPDPITLAISFESGYREAAEVIDKGTHATTLGHYGLANTLLTCNLNPKCYMMDAFPEFDSKSPSLLVDDSCRFISDAFANRLEKFIRDGGIYVVTPETDKLNHYAFFKRFGITFGTSGMVSGDGVKVLYIDRIVTPAVAVKVVGKGKLVMMNREFHKNFDPDAPKVYCKFIRDLFCSLGKFKPMVQSSESGVFAAPYKASNGNVLVLAVNINPGFKTSQISLSTNALLAKTVTDLGSERQSKLYAKNGYYVSDVTLMPLSCTILRFE